MAASASSVQLPCAFVETSFRGSKSTRSKPLRARPLLVVAEKQKSKAIDRRGTVAALAGLLAGASFPALAKSAIDSSALLKQYESSKAGSNVKDPATALEPTPPTKKTAPAVAGNAPRKLNTIVVGGAALIASAFALGSSTSEGSGGPKVKPFARAPSRGSRRTGASRVIGTRPIRKTATRGRTVVVSARPPPRKPSPKPPVPRRLTPKKGAAAKPKPKVGSSSTQSEGSKANNSLSTAVGIGAVVGAALLFLGQGSSVGQKPASPKVTSTSKPAAVKKSTKLVLAPASRAPPPAATRKTAVKRPQPRLSKEAQRAKLAQQFKAKTTTTKVTKPKTAVKKSTVVKTKPVGARPPKQKVVKRKRVVTRGPPRRRKPAETPASTLFLALLVLAGAGTYVYLQEDGSSSSSSSAALPSTSGEIPAKPEEVEVEEAVADDGDEDEPKKGLFGFGKQ